MSKQIELRKVRRGERFVLDGVKFVKLDDDSAASFVLTADTLPGYCVFEDENATLKDHNNFVGSMLQKRITRWLHEDHRAISKAVIERPIDLTSMDGLTDYGSSFTFARILTSDEYRKYRWHIPLTAKPYWLATPWCTSSSASHSAYNACIVNTGGSLNISNVCNANYNCPRPALYLEFSILVSVETDEEEKSIHDYTDTELIDELYRRRNHNKCTDDSGVKQISGRCLWGGTPKKEKRKDCASYSLAPGSGAYLVAMGFALES